MLYKWHVTRSEYTRIYTYTYNITIMKCYRNLIVLSPPIAWKINTQIPTVNKIHKIKC